MHRLDEKVYHFKVVMIVFIIVILIYIFNNYYHQIKIDKSIKEGSKDIKESLIPKKRDQKGRSYSIEKIKTKHINEVMFKGNN